MLHIGRIGLALFFFFLWTMNQTFQILINNYIFCNSHYFFSNLDMRNSTRLIINNIHLTQFNTHFTHFWDLINKSVVWPMLSLVARDNKYQWNWTPKTFLTLNSMFPMASICYWEPESSLSPWKLYIKQYPEKIMGGSPEHMHEE